MSLQGPELIQHAAERVEEWLSVTPDAVDVFLGDRLVQDQVTLHLLLSMTAVLSVAAEAVRSLKIPPSPGLTGLLETLVEAGALDVHTASNLAPGVELRNRVLFDIQAAPASEIYTASRVLPGYVADLLTELSGVVWKREAPELGRTRLKRSTSTSRRPKKGAG